MTPDQRAIAWCVDGWSNPETAIVRHGPTPCLHCRPVAYAIRAAVAAEQKRCDEIVGEFYVRGGGDLLITISDRIREGT